MLLSLLDFEGKKGMLQLRNGTKMSEKHVNYSYGYIQTQQQVG
jgi:hypothetical protein